VWSLATIASAAAPSYEVLLLCRALVGVGEGVYGPGSNALLCATSSPERRGRALGIYNVGMALGGAAGLAVGVGLGPILGWRGAMLIAGLPGLVLAVASMFVVVPVASTHAETISARAVLARPVFLITLAAGALATFGMSGLITWSEYLLGVERNLPRVSAGAFMLAVGILCGAGGAVLGGSAGDAAKRRHAGGHSLVIGTSFIAGGCVALLALHTYALAPFLALVALTILLLSIYNGPAAAVVHEMVPPRLAATAQGVFLFGIHLLGNAPAPAVVGWIAERSTVTTALHVPVAAFVASGVLFLTVAGIQRRPKGGGRPCWRSPLVSALTAVLLLNACATKTPASPWHEQRSRLGTVEVTVVERRPDASVAGPTPLGRVGGAGVGAARGVGRGLLGGLVCFLTVGRAGEACVVAVATPYWVGRGIVEGAIHAVPEGQRRANEAAIAAAIEEVETQRIARALTKERDERAWVEGERIDVVIEIRLLRLGLERSSTSSEEWKFANPSLHVIVEAGLLIKGATDKKVWFERTYRHQSASRTFDEWGRDGAAEFKASRDTALDALARDIARDVFSDDVTP
jgi:predicted MFS family arabinose efflux permease